MVFTAAWQRNCLFGGCNSVFKWSLEPPAIILKPLFMLTCFFPALLYFHTVDVQTFWVTSVWLNPCIVGSWAAPVEQLAVRSGLLIDIPSLHFPKQTLNLNQWPSQSWNCLPSVLLSHTEHQKDLYRVKYKLDELHNPPKLSLLRNWWSCNNAFAFTSARSSLHMPE